MTEVQKVDVASVVSPDEDRRASIKDNEAASLSGSSHGFDDLDAAMDIVEDEEEIVRRGNDWRAQLTARAMIVGLLTGVLISFVAVRLSVTGAGVSPGYSVVAALVGYAILRPFTAVAIRFWNTVAPFTKQENNLIQAVATSVQSLQHALGVSTWFWAMHENVAAQLDLGIDTFEKLEELKENQPESFPLANTVEVNIGSMIGVAFLISFTGILIVTVFRKLLIVDMRLPFPSPTATAVMINSFFTEAGRDLADRQLKWFLRVSGLSFLWAMFVWLTAPAGCGSFNAVPLFGLKAVNAGWQLSIGDYLQFVGIGIIMGPNISYSIVLGGILSYGITYPLLWRKGVDPTIWDDRNITDFFGISEEEYGNMTDTRIAELIEERNNILKDENDYWFFTNIGSSMDGFYGYKIMWGMIILLGDGVFALCMMGYIGYSQWKVSRNSDKDVAAKEAALANETPTEREFRINARIFTEDQVDNRIIVGLYCLVTLVGAIGLPLLYPVKWYMILIAFLLTPIFAIIGNYIAGLTDWNLVSNFAKLAVLIFGVWASYDDPDNAVVIALMTCGIVYCGASNSTDIIGDLMTGFLTRTSPKAMIIAQLIGFAFGCVCLPVVFYLFVNAAPDMGFPRTTYPNTYGTIYGAMARLGVKGGFDALPKHALTGTYVIFVLSFLMPAAKLAVLNHLEKKEKMKAHDAVSFWWPAPMAMGIPFIAGTDWVVPTGIGLIIKLIWKRRNFQNHEDFHQVIAAALLVGVGVWSIPAVLISLAEGEAPESLCINFYDSNEYGPSY